jgi:hypothetical protein
MVEPVPKRLLRFGTLELEDLNMKQVICKSGLKGSEQRLQRRYDSFVEFQAYSDTYGLATRLGYKSAETAWKANPLVQSSVEPSDFRKVRAKPDAKQGRFENVPCRGGYGSPQKCPACKHYSCICQRVDD